MSNLSMILPSVLSSWLVSSIWLMFMLRSTTSDAFAISSAAGAPNVTMVSGLATSISPVS